VVVVVVEQYGLVSVNVKVPNVGVRTDVVLIVQVVVWDARVGSRIVSEVVVDVALA
jgi:hypothetical protein